ncbi:MAG: hypothetical protein KME45_19985 [Stenomitos rutilans HA7619-LM2]|jgi:methyl-accepting chemotaxis protein|nr:hypothetical protein [Stenomitos rutilans HA7619-LM2]MBW4472629.1 hypothetical protein [Stenomitos rutilans HA7619-LM2]
MDQLRREYRDLIFERNRFRDAQAEALLGHDSELVKFYYFETRRYQMKRELQERLMMLIDLDNPLLGFAMGFCRYKDLSERVQQWDELEGVANDTADAFASVIEQLQAIVVEVRQQVAALPPLGGEDVMRRVSEAESRASKMADQLYGARVLELQRLIVAQDKRSAPDSAV